jgi:hypothetical protein
VSKFTWHSELLYVRTPLGPLVLEVLLWIEVGRFLEALLSQEALLKGPLELLNELVHLSLTFDAEFFRVEILHDLSDQRFTQDELLVDLVFDRVQLFRFFFEPVQLPVLFLAVLQLFN